MRQIVIIGASGFGLELVTYLVDLQSAGAELTVKGFLDDAPRPLVSPDFPIPVPDLGTIDEWVPTASDELLIAVGDPVARYKILRRLEAKQARYFTLVHPTAYVADSAVLEQGAIVCPLAFVGPLARIGTCAVLNVQASLGHEAKLGEASVLSPGVKVGGQTVIGEACLLGSLAVTAPLADLGAFSKLSAGAFLKGKAEPGSLVVGNPAKARVMFRRP